MTQSGPRSLIESVLESLKGTDTNWENQAEVLEDCMDELRQMSMAIPDPSKPRHGSAAPDGDSGSQGIKEAIPHVEQMRAALLKRDKAHAIIHGMNALRQVP